MFLVKLFGRGLAMGERLPSIVSLSQGFLFYTCKPIDKSLPRITSGKHVRAMNTPLNPTVI